jgi:hypothetical protein
VGKTKWNLKNIKGQENPKQGWYSRVYNEFVPNEVSVCNTLLSDDDIFVWLLLPCEKGMPLFKTSILSKDKDKVKVRVDIAGKGRWDVTVPFMDKNEVKVKISEH